MVKKNTYQSAEEVPVWQKAHELVILVYKVTECFPKKEVYGLTSQLRRSSMSIAANISEGFYRNSTKELLQFLYNARDSLGETLYHLRLSRDLKYLREKEYQILKEACNEVGRQLNGWVKSLRSKL